MKLLKHFLCLVACFVVLSSSFVIGYAADEEEPLYPRDYLFDIGFVDVGYGVLGYFGEDDPFDRGISLFSASSKNVPNFNYLTDVPWSTFPQYIKDIMYMNIDSLTTGSPYKVPFFCIQVDPNGNTNIWAGINVGFGRLNDTLSSASIYTPIKDSHSLDNIFPNSCLYRFAYNFKTGVVNLNWSKMTPSVFGNVTNSIGSPNLYRFAPWNIINNDSVTDLYCYGANGVYYPSSLTALAVAYSRADENIMCNFAFPKAGFSSGVFISGDDDFYPNCYFESFVPPSESLLILQQQNNLIEEGNSELADINDSLNQSGDSDFSTTLPDESLSEYEEMESGLVDDYNPDNIEDDLDIELDPSALEFIMDAFNSVVTADNAVFTLFISVMSIGILALILGR